MQELLEELVAIMQRGNYTFDDWNIFAMAVPRLINHIRTLESQLGIAREAMEKATYIHREAATRPGGHTSVSSAKMCMELAEALSQIINAQ